MTSQMVRKQIYIHKRQESRLKRISKARGLSEAEIIRQALEHEIGGGSQQGERYHTSALSGLEDFTRLALAKRAQAGKAETYRWNRAEIYAERESRWVRDQDEQDEQP